MARLDIEHVHKVLRGGQSILCDINCVADDGELLAVVGPSGCGKSTLLRLIAGLDQMTSGEIRIDGKRINELSPQQRNIAMVFQNHALYPHMTVYHNLAFGLRVRRVPKAMLDARVRRTAAQLGLQTLLTRYPRELSGGQRQRTALGRAMLRDPQVFLLDEPLSSLDVPLRAEMRRELALLHNTLGTTMIYVTHDQSEALSLGQRVVVLADGQVQQIDTPDVIYNQPANRFVASFIGWPPMNFIGGESLNTDGNARIGDPRLEYGVRPERLSTRPRGADDLCITGRLERIEPLGGEWQVELVHRDTHLIARMPPDESLRQGGEVRVWFNLADVYAFDRVTGNRVQVRP